ncbi:hypothetical protein BDV19DRAFT_67687 [Aspergillus venezuelensis]
MSGSKPRVNAQGRIYIQADSPREPLDTIEKRERSLTIYADHGDWSAPTPFTSFARYPSRIENLASKRDESKRGRKRLIAIDPNVRIAKGLPFLHMETEMLRYGVGDPYGRGYESYGDEYITLWEVTADEVVGCWDWEDDDWYKDVVLPAFRKHDGRFKALTGFGMGADVLREVGIPGFL